MSQKIEQALIGGYKAAIGYNAGTKLPATEWENVSFDAKGLQLWYSVSVITDTSSVATLGDTGEDETRGFLQIDINVPVKTGKGVLLQKAAIFRSYFTAGRHLTYDGVTVTITNVGASSAREVDNWYRITVSVYFYSRAPRA